MRFGYISGEKSIYKDVYKLPPGSFLKFDYENSYLEIKNYWNI